MLLLLLLPQAAASVRLNSKCLVPADGTHQEVDLNVLMSTSDEVIVSKSSTSYSYHLNVCGETILQNGGCSAGSSICEVKDATDGLDSYGYVDTISTAWESDTLVMSMEGEEVCPFLKSKPYTSKIYFKCAQSVSVASVVEDYYKCNVEIEYNTPVACGHAEKKYKCDKNQCVADSGGSFPSAAACLAGCGAPSAKFACDATNHMCIENSSGKYADLNDCAKNCDAPVDTGYTCNGTTWQCVPKQGGQYKDSASCQQNCAPWVRHYQCFDNRCVRNSIGKFTSPEACAAVCQSVPSSSWACGPDNTCTEDNSGTYKTEAQCQGGCGGGLLYACNEAKQMCEASDHGIANKAVCEDACSGRRAANGTNNSTKSRGKFIAGPHGRHLSES